MDAMLNEIIQSIDESIQSWGGDYGACYVGITNDLERRLFEQHHVDKESRFFVHRNAGNFHRAGEVEKYFINRGCRGAPAGGTVDTTFVYAYYMTESTEP
jgi:hypothetical protein